MSAFYMCMFVSVYICVALLYSVYISVLDVHSHTVAHTHTYAGVSLPLCVCVSECAHSHSVCAHASLSQREGGCIHLSQSIFWR